MVERLNKGLMAVWSPSVLPGVLEAFRPKPAGLDEAVKCGGAGSSGGPQGVGVCSGPALRPPTPPAGPTGPLAVPHCTPALRAGLGLVQGA
eukprot:8026131-Pyramimonas_sp.AAC.1